LKFQAVAEKTAKNCRGLLFLPHLVGQNSKSLDRIFGHFIIAR